MLINHLVFMINVCSKFLLNKSNSAIQLVPFISIWSIVTYRISEQWSMFKVGLHSDKYLLDRIYPSTMLIRLASGNLNSAKASAHAHKVTQECILATMYTPLVLFINVLFVMVMTPFCMPLIIVF